MPGKRIYEFGAFRLDTGERVLQNAGSPVSIAPKALDVLIALVENRGHIVEKEELMRQVWPGTFVEENNLAFNISVLRKVLGEKNAGTRFIETVPKRGYRFVGEVIEIAAEEVPDAPASAAEGMRHRTNTVFVRPRIVIGVVSVIAAVTLLTVRLRPTQKLTDKDTIILADFANRTGDPVFDGTLRQGLAIQLGQSPFISLISDERIRHTLRLMSQPENAPLTPKLAREVCERTGSAAVLEGSITTLGSEYVLAFEAKNCGNGDVLDDQQMQVKRKEDVLDAVSRTARRFRSRMVSHSPASNNMTCR